MPPSFRATTTIVAAVWLSIVLSSNTLHAAAASDSVGSPVELRDVNKATSSTDIDAGHKAVNVTIEDCVFEKVVTIRNIVVTNDTAPVFVHIRRSVFHRLTIIHCNLLKLLNLIAERTMFLR